MDNRKGGGIACSDTAGRWVKAQCKAIINKNNAKKNLLDLFRKILKDEPVTDREMIAAMDNI